MVGFKNLEQVSLRMTISKIEARRLQHQSLEADDGTGMQFEALLHQNNSWQEEAEYRVIRRQPFGGGIFEIVRRTENFAGLFQCVLDFAGCEQGSSCSVLEAQSSFHGSRPTMKPPDSGYISRNFR